MYSFRFDLVILQEKNIQLAELREKLSEMEVSIAGVDDYWGFMNSFHRQGALNCQSCRHVLRKRCVWLDMCSAG